MKKLIVLVCLIVSAVSLHARAVQEDIKKAGDKAQESYAFGMLIGANLRTANVEFDYNAFTEGVRAVVEGAETAFSEQEAVEIVETALQRSMDKIYEENRIREEEFFAVNGRKENVHVTASGLQYEILTDSDAEKPLSNSVVKVNYVGSFIDGSPFDKSDEETGAYIPLEMVIPGWSEGLMLMGVGSTYKFYIPSSLAYGRDGIQQVIPPYSPLVFIVDLLEIVNEDRESFNAQDAESEN